MIGTVLERSELKEDTRPTLYRAMKYWGKKPHNIWGYLIEKFTDINSIIYDPFAGSALTFFESIKINRKPIVIDINPMTVFLVDFYSRNFDESDILKNYEIISHEVKQSNIYTKNYRRKCKICGNKLDINNFRWEDNKIKQTTYFCTDCYKVIMDDNVEPPYEENLGLWKPDFDLNKLCSISKRTIESFGGSNFDNIYTKRNIELLSFIFDRVMKINNSNTRMALFFCFIRTLHLTTKMNALRSAATNRPLSTSWGRPAYMFLSDRMEQNPLIQFERSLFDKNGILNSIKSRNTYLKKYTYTNVFNKIASHDGIALQADSKNIDLNNKVDMVITDPPYGDIIQYGELSLIWNLWLNKYDNKFKINLKDEIIVNKENDYAKFENNLFTVFDNCSKALKNNGYFVLTFHSDNVSEWNCVKSALQKTGLKLVDSYLQMNKRSGESNVIAKEGKTISDYYFILKKTN